MTFASEPLPPMDGVFAAVPNARNVDQTELNRIRFLADSAAQRLDVTALEGLRLRVDAISNRNQMHFGVMSLVRQVQNHIKRQQMATTRTLKGMGL